MERNEEDGQQKEHPRILQYNYPQTTITRPRLLVTSSNIIQTKKSPPTCHKANFEESNRNSANHSFSILCARKNTSSSVRVHQQLDLFLRPVNDDDVLLGVQILRINAIIPFFFSFSLGFHSLNFPADSTLHCIHLHSDSKPLSLSPTDFFPHPSYKDSMS